MNDNQTATDDEVLADALVIVHDALLAAIRLGVQRTHIASTLVGLAFDLGLAAGYTPESTASVIRGLAKECCTKPPPRMFSKGTS